MAIEQELERTFLAKKIPEDIENFPFEDMSDNYIPKDSRHPILRIRKKGEKMVITKKYIKNEGDASEMAEETIILTPDEYESLNKVQGKSFSKKRYIYEYAQDKKCEIDIYKKELAGLVVVDFEFLTNEEKNNLEIPDFCLVEVTNEEFLAGGMLCGKKYSDLEEILKKFKYEKIVRNE